MRDSADRAARLELTELFEGSRAPLPACVDREASDPPLVVAMDTSSVDRAAGELVRAGPQRADAPPRGGQDRPRSRPGPAVEARSDGSLLGATIRIDDAWRVELLATTGALARRPSTPVDRKRVARRAVWRYLAHALRHPDSLILLAVAVLLSLVTLSLTVLLSGVVAELLFLTVIQRLGFFRRRLEASLEQEERAAAVRRRDMLVQQMDSRHRQELMSLELLVGRTRENLGLGPSSCALLEDGLGLSRLLGSYVRFAIAHKSGEESLARTSRQALQDAVRLLEAGESSSPERMRGLVERRLSIARMRLSCWERTRENVEAIGHQLAGIRDLIHLTYEKSIGWIESRDSGKELEQFLHDLEANESIIRDLAELEFEQKLGGPGLGADGAFRVKTSGIREGR